MGDIVNGGDGTMLDDETVRLSLGLFSGRSAQLGADGYRGSGESLYRSNVGEL